MATQASGSDSRDWLDLVASAANRL